MHFFNQLLMDTILFPRNSYFSLTKWQIIFNQLWLQPYRPHFTSGNALNQDCQCFYPHNNRLKRVKSSTCLESSSCSSTSSLKLKPKELNILKMMSFSAPSGSSTRYVYLSFMLQRIHSTRFYELREGGISNLSNSWHHIIYM